MVVCKDWTKFIHQELRLTFKSRLPHIITTNISNGHLFRILDIGEGENKSWSLSDNRNYIIWNYRRNWVDMIIFRLGTKITYEGSLPFESSWELLREGTIDMEIEFAHVEIPFNIIYGRYDIPRNGSTYKRLRITATRGDIIQQQIIPIEIKSIFLEKQVF